MLWKSADFAKYDSLHSGVHSESDLAKSLNQSESTDFQKLDGDLSITPVFTYAENDVLVLLLCGNVSDM